MIGQRLKLARSAAGLSLRNLEAKIGNRVTAQAIGKYERNESMPSSGILMALAGALSVSVEYLVNDQEIILEGVEFRKDKITSKREEYQVKGKVLQFLERYLMVEELLNLPSVEWHSPREGPYPVMRDYSEADGAARSLRDHWGLGNDPIPNLIELLEEQGIKVLTVDSEKIDGLIADVRRTGKGAVPVIVVNRKTWGERQRFTLAHELGHLVLTVATNVDEEKAAHRFAGAFLMPADALWATIGKYRTAITWGELFALKQLFGASVQAIVYRCKDLGIISEATFRKLFGKFNSLGWRSPPYKEPYSRGVEEPKRFERLTFRAIAEGAISEANAAELLSMSVYDLKRKFMEPPGFIADATVDD